MLEKLINKFNFRSNTIEEKMTKLHSRLNYLQIQELSLKDNYSTSLKETLSKNQTEQYIIIDTLFSYQKKSPNFQYD